MPAIRNRLEAIQNGGKVSMATLMAKYVEPQSTYTAAKAMAIRRRLGRESIAASGVMRSASRLATGISGTGSGRRDSSLMVSSTMVVRVERTAGTAPTLSRRSLPRCSGSAALTFTR